MITKKEQLKKWLYHEIDKSKREHKILLGYDVPKFEKEIDFLKYKIEWLEEQWNVLDNID